MAHDVFISYSSGDKSVADAICAFLEERRVRCWIAPRDIYAGLDWGEAIIDAIEQCRVMVLVFSSRANTSAQIKREVERAVAKGVVVVPVRIEDVLPSKTLEYFISGSHWLDALTPPFEAHLRRLAKTIALLLPDTASDPEQARESGPATSAAAPGLPRPYIAALVVAVVSLAGVAAYWLDSAAVPPAVQTNADPPASAPSQPPAGSSASPSPSADPASSQSRAADTFRDAWRRLGSMTDACKAEFSGWDPYDTEYRKGSFGGGLRMFGCFAGSLVSYDSLQRLSPAPIFLAGPHAGGVDWENDRSFGHYNPAFVRWFVDSAVPAADDSGFRAATQGLYDRHVRPLARVFVETYRKARRENACFQNEVAKYEALARAGTLPDGYYVRFATFLDPRFCANPGAELDQAGPDWERPMIVMTTTAFWVRRSIDGTAEEFSRGLFRLLRAYDRSFLESSEH